jgi:citrate lyase beta subunit
VSAREQVTAFVRACAHLEERHAIAPVSLELQVETARAVVSPAGTATVATMVTAAGGRCAGLHYGTYDYSAALGLAPDQQRADHPVAEHAKAVMAVVGAGAGVPVCDGSSAVLPTGDGVRDAWRTQARIVRRALELGIGQGWDMHPGLVPVRLAVVQSFHRAGAPSAVARLRAYREGASSGVLDEPATERALVGFLRRGLACGALDDDEVAGLL